MCGSTDGWDGGLLTQGGVGLLGWMVAGFGGTHFDGRTFGSTVS